MEIKNYISISLQWAWLLILGLLLGAAGAYTFSYYEVPAYRASTRVQVISAPKGSGGDLSYISDQQLSQTYVQTIKTRPILQLVGQELGYEVRAGQISVSALSNTQLIDISVEDSDPQRAADIANTLVAVFAKLNSEKQALRYADSESSLKTQISQIETQITALQDQTSAEGSAKFQENLTRTQSEMKRLFFPLLVLGVFGCCGVCAGVLHLWRRRGLVHGRTYSFFYRSHVAVADLAPRRKHLTTA